MKKFFATTKYLWIGGIMGILQQLLGDLDYILHQRSGIFSFSQIMGGLTIYAAIILLVIRRDVPPKHQFRDLILFFVGLDFFYYLCIFIFELTAFIAYKMNPLDITLAVEYPFAKTMQEIGDFIYWTSIGLAAAVWAYVATKLRNLGKKKLYIIMLLPLFAVMVIELIAATGETIMFFITGGEKLPAPNAPIGTIGYSNWHNSYLAGALTSLIALVLCLYKFLKKPAMKKNQKDKRTEEKTEDGSVS